MHPKSHGIGQNVSCAVGDFLFREMWFIDCSCTHINNIVLHKRYLGMRMYKWALPFGCSKKPIFHVLCTHESLQMDKANLLQVHSVHESNGHVGHLVNLTFEFPSNLQDQHEVSYMYHSCLVPDSPLCPGRAWK